jgi:hypothetical protein
MPWPSPQDYQEAVQSPALCFSDLDLKFGIVEEDSMGLPRPISGGFAVVYKIRSNGRTWAVRCFQSQIMDQAERYAAVSKHLQAAGLPYTVGFNYLQEGIRVHGRWHPVLKMEWVEGPSLIEFVQQHLSDAEAIRRLAARWLTMAQGLREASFAHGDLQHGNVLVVGGDLKLIDYDGVFVPALTGRNSNEYGHRNFQHPQRNSSDYGPSLDNFSNWIVYFSLVALSLAPSLWSELSAGDECLLFRQADYERPEDSVALSRLEHHSDPRLQEIGNALHDLWVLPLQRIPPIDGDLPGVGQHVSPSPVQSAIVSGGEWWQDHLPASTGVQSQTIDDPFTPSRDAKWLADLSAPTPTPFAFQTAPTLPRFVLAAALTAGLVTPALGHLRVDLVIEPLVAALCGLFPYSLYRRESVLSTRDTDSQRRQDIAKRVSALRMEWGEHLDQRERLEEAQRQKQAPIEERLFQLERQMQVRREQIEAALTLELTAIKRRTDARIIEVESRVVGLHERYRALATKHKQKETELRFHADAALAAFRGGLQAAEQEWKRAQITTKQRRDGLQAEQAAELRQIRDVANVEIARRNAEIRSLTATLGASEAEAERQRDLLQTRVRGERANALRLRDRKSASALRDIEELQQALDEADAEYEIDARRLRSEIDGLPVQEQREIKAELPYVQEHYKKDFLARRSIASALIPGITPSHVRNLKARGYVMAGDINAGVAEVTGIGKQKAFFILDWRDQQERLAQKTLIGSIPNEMREKITLNYQEKRKTLNGQLRVMTERHQQHRAAILDQLAFRESILKVEMNAAELVYTETLSQIEAYIQEHNAEFGRKETRLGEEYAMKVDALKAEIIALRTTVADGNAVKSRLDEDEIVRWETVTQVAYEQKRQEFVIQIAARDAELRDGLADIGQHRVEAKRNLTQEEGEVEAERKLAVQVRDEALAAARHNVQERLDAVQSQASPDLDSLLKQKTQCGESLSASYHHWHEEDRRLRGVIRSVIDEANLVDREWTRYEDLSYWSFIKKVIFVAKRC